MRGPGSRHNGAIPNTTSSPGPRSRHRQTAGDLLPRRRGSAALPSLRPVSQGGSRRLALNRTKSHQFAVRKKRSPNVHTPFPNQTWSRSVKAGQTNRVAGLCAVKSSEQSASVELTGISWIQPAMSVKLGQTRSNQSNQSAEHPKRRKKSATSSKAGGVSKAERLKAAWPFGHGMAQAFVGALLLSRPVPSEGGKWGESRREGNLTRIRIFSPARINTCLLSPALSSVPPRREKRGWGCRRNRQTSGVRRQCRRISCWIEQSGKASA